MKIKVDFVTNSSSTSYIISINKRTSSVQYKFMERFALEEFENIEDLKAYTSNRNKDWVNNCMGVKFINMSEEEYDMCSHEIGKGSAILIVDIDNDILDEEFYDNYEGHVISTRR